MTDFQQYRRTQIAELRPYVPGEDMVGVSISSPDLEAGSPKLGDMIARNPKNHTDQWLVAAQYFADNFESLNATDWKARAEAAEARVKELESRLTVTDEMVERAARAFARDWWQHANAYDRARYRTRARAALTTALERATDD